MKNTGLNEAYALFGERKVAQKHQPTVRQLNVDMEWLIEQQAQLLVDTYGSVCFDAKKLQEILGVGESKVYEILKDPNFPVKTMGKRKFVTAMGLSAWLELQNTSCDSA